MKCIKMISEEEENKNMNTLEIQYEYNGEWFPIWETAQTDLELAWKEMDEQPSEGGHIRFKDSTEFMVVNGGFR